MGEVPRCNSIPKSITLSGGSPGSSSGKTSTYSHTTRGRSKSGLSSSSRVSVTPQTRGSVDYPSTCGIQVDVGLPDATLENRAESPLYGELYPNTTPA